MGRCAIPTIMAVAILERTVLAELAEARRCNGEFCFVRIAKIEEATGLGPELIRAILRQLVDQGLAEYRRGLFTEDGEVAGSGYAATLAGMAKKLEVRA